MEASDQLYTAVALSPGRTLQYAWSMELGGHSASLHEFDMRTIPAPDGDRTGIFQLSSDQPSRCTGSSFSERGRVLSPSLYYS